MEILTYYFHTALDYLVIFIESIGYFGIFIGMFLESSFVPVPSEIIMIPAGISVSYGNMNLYLVIIAGTLGSLFGALFNYFLAVSVGRTILFKIGRYFFIKPATIIKIEDYFKKHGAISTFMGRLIPVIRQYISLPAGIAKMNLTVFCLYTTAGSFIWVTILTYLGFLIGENQELIEQYLHIAIISSIIICVVTAVIYVLWKRRQKTVD